MVEYYVEVEQGAGSWEPLMGFDKDDANLIVWQASEMLTDVEADQRRDELKAAYPDRNFRVTKVAPPGLGI